MASGASSPFDAVAEGYDRTFGRSPAGRLFRFRLAERIGARVPPGSRLLDIGAGTGEDAVWLSRQGFDVLGLEPSAGMAAVARAKAKRAGAAVRFEERGFEGFAPAAPFDAAYSNFGAMNCVPLDAWAGSLSKAVRPDGSLFLVLMGRRPLPALLRSGPAAWRQRGQATARLGERAVPVIYPDPAEVAEALASSFALTRTETLGFLVPHPGADDWPRRHPILFGVLAGLERLVARWRILCGFSDHYLVELRRREGSS